MNAFTRSSIAFHNVGKDDLPSVHISLNRGINNPDIVWVSLDFLGNTTTFYCDTWEVALALFAQLGGKHSMMCSCPDCEAK